MEKAAKGEVTPLLKLRLLFREWQRLDVSASVYAPWSAALVLFGPTSPPTYLLVWLLGGGKAKGIENVLRREVKDRCAQKAGTHAGMLARESLGMRCC